MLDAHPTSLSPSHLEKIPADFFIHGLCVKEDHGWTAILLDFDVAGAGTSPHEAVRDALARLDDYLELCFDEGLEFEEAIRPAPERLQKAYQQAMKAAALTATDPMPSPLPPPNPAEAFRQPIHL